MSNAIAYYRVSTAKQGASGLGLEAQKAAVQAYALATGGTVEASYVEIESGKISGRPKLQAALAHAKRNKARLVVAKLDRLARNMAFTSAVMDAGVDFVACDNPHANRLTLHVLAAVAENEARQISERTKAALAAAKARGQLLGSARPGHWAGREDARLAGLAKARREASRVNHAKALEAVADLLPEMQARREAGATLATIANELNAAGQRTQRGNNWTAMGVKLVLDRATAK